MPDALLEVGIGVDMSMPGMNPLTGTFAMSAGSFGPTNSKINSKLQVRQ